MPNLFLTSNAYMVLDEWTQKLSQKPHELKVAFIPTASHPEKRTEYVGMDRDALVTAGFQVIDLEIKGKKEEELRSFCKDIDVFFVGGGNVFYLLQEMRKSGFDKVLRDQISKGKWYVGSSAGSVVTGPDIGYVDVLDDPNVAPELESTIGLNLIDVLVIPHWGKYKYKEEYLQIMEKVFSNDLKVIPLQDTQALLVEGESYQIVQITDKNKIAMETYSKIANTYAKKYFEDLSDASYIDRFSELLPEEGKILDIGSGPGQFSSYLQKQGFQVVGIDFSSEMIEIARQEVPDVQFRKMDMRRLELPSEMFDGLLVAYSLIHIPTVELRTTLKGFYRVLKPGGYILFITQKGEPDQVVTEPFDTDQKMFINFFTRERMKDLLEQTEFEVTFQDEIKTTDPEAMSEKVIYTIARKSEK